MKTDVVPMFHPLFTDTMYVTYFIRHFIYTLIVIFILFVLQNHFNSPV